MIRKMLCLFCLAGLLGLAVPAKAAEYGGSIRVHLEVGELPVTNGAFTIYRVGTPVSDGYRIAEVYGGGFVKEEDALSPHLSQWMTEAEGKEGKPLLLDVDGNAVFTGLEEGLYLLEQTEWTDGFYPIQPFLITIPSGTRWEVTVNTDPLPRVVESPPTGQDPTPYIGLVGMGISLVGLYFCTGGKLRKR